MDLAKLTLADLRALQADIGTEIKKRQHDEVERAKKEIIAIAESVGLPLEDLVGKNLGKLAGAKVAVRFRNPDDDKQEWSGRGRAPKWVKEWTEGGKSIDALRV